MRPHSAAFTLLLSAESEEARDVATRQTLAVRRHRRGRHGGDRRSRHRRGSEEGGAEGGAGEEGGAEPSDAAETPDASHPEVTAESGTDLRQAPDPGSPVLAALPRGEKLTVICAAEGAAGGTWHLVRTDHYAWAPAADIALHGAAPSRC